MKKFIEKNYDFVCSNFKLMTVVGYVIIVATALLAALNTYLLPVSIWEWLAGLHWIPKTVFGLIALPFIMCAGAHMLELRPKTE